MRDWRLARVNDLLREVIAEIVARELKDPRLDLAVLSITTVSASPDLRRAHVKVSIMGTDQQRADAVVALNRSSPYIRRLLKDRVTLKAIPSLHFEHDASIAEDRRIHDLLDALQAGRPTEDDKAP